MNYLDYKISAGEKYSCCTKDILKAIAYRYINANKECDFFMRPWINSGFMQSADGIIHIDFAEKYPESKIGSYAYACAYIFSDIDTKITVSINVSTGGEIWINRKCIARTTIEDENNPKKRNVVIDVNKGKNPVFIKAQKTSLGFGVGFGEGCIAWKPMYLHMPFSEYDGYLGISYSKPFDYDIFSDSNMFPNINGSIPQEFIAPKLTDDFAFAEDGYVYSTSYITVDEKCTIKLKLNSSEKNSIYVNGVFAGEFDENEINVDLNKGKNRITLETIHRKENIFKLDVEATKDGKKIFFEKSEYVLSDTPWICIGVFSKKQSEIINADGPEKILKYNETFWRAGVSENYLRKLRENDIYGKWTYPIGVILYGLKRASEGLNDSSILSYAKKHLMYITQNQSYADFDMKMCGVPSINRQLSCMGMLDYCGSCGNAMLEIMSATGADEDFKNIAARVADYIENGQERLENGMFFRKRPDSVIDYMTIWADDLYMSVPFLCRYYKLTGEEKYLNDAATQIVRFKEKLYMSERGLMSHVYNLIYNKKTGVPWGRGNGWTLFAITELLEVLPKSHNMYDEIIDFYYSFCRGILQNQDESGMWHQVLDDCDSYKEISCTAMFTYSFARGVIRNRLGKEFYDSALKGWNAIVNNAVDEDGNVYGVCCGSAYSFRYDYYKNELPWVLNDTHGIGIVLLAGVEVDVLEKGE